MASYRLDIGGTPVPDQALRSGTLRWSRGLDQLRVLSPPRAGQLGAVLSNHDGAYNPGVTPLRAGQEVALTADAGGGPVALFSGVMERPRLRVRSFAEAVELGAFGTLSRLAGAGSLTTAVYADIRTDEAVGHVLDAIGWPAEARLLDEGRTLMRLWWLDGQDVFAALRELLATEGPGALLYEDGAGRIVFRNRWQRILEARAVAVQAAYGVGALPLLAVPEPAYDDGLGDVVNHCTVAVRQWTPGPEAVVWELGAGLVLQGGQSRTFEARAGGGALLQDAVTPSAGGGDFTVLAGGLPSVSLDRTSGPSVAVTVTGAAGSGSQLGGLRLRATPLTVTSATSISNSLDTSASQAEFGVRTYPLPVRAEIDPDVARDFANAVVSYYQRGRPQLRFATVNASQAALASILEREIGDRVHVTLGRLGIDADVLVLQREDELAQGLVHRATFGTELASAVSYFRLDHSLLADDPPSPGDDVLTF